MTALRIALLGAGSHSRSHHGPSLRDWAARHPGQVERVAVCDLDEAKATAYAQEFGFSAVRTDLARMLAEDGLDGLVAVTPMARTEDLASQVLRARVPVVVEKPPGVGVDGAQRLWRLAQETGTPHMVSFNRRFSPALTRAQAWMRAQGRRPRHVISRMLRHRRLEPEFARDTGLHQVDAVLAVIGRPARAVGHDERGPGARAALYTGRIETADGASASIVQTPDVGRVEESMEILGDGFRILVDFQDAGVRIDADGGTVLQWTAAQDGLAEHEACGAYDETAAFLEGLRDGRPLAPTLADGLVTMRATAALQEGRAVEGVSDGAE